MTKLESDISGCRWRDTALRTDEDEIMKKPDWLRPNMMSLDRIKVMLWRAIARNPSHRSNRADFHSMIYCCCTLYFRLGSWSLICHFILRHSELYLRHCECISISLLYLFSTWQSELFICLFRCLWLKMWIEYFYHTTVNQWYWCCDVCMSSFSFIINFEYITNVRCTCSEFVFVLSGHIDVFIRSTSFSGSLSQINELNTHCIVYCRFYVHFHCYSSRKRFERSQLKMSEYESDVSCFASTLLSSVVLFSQNLLWFYVKKMVTTSTVIFPGWRIPQWQRASWCLLDSFLRLFSFRTFSLLSTRRSLPEFAVFRPINIIFRSVVNTTTHWNVSEGTT